MEDYTKLVLRKICCTCLSIDRKLSQLCKVEDGVNNLFFLLSSDSEAYEAMFSRDATHLFICWECNAFMRRQRKFQNQVCIAQKQLSQIVDEQIAVKPQNSLSKLTWIHRKLYDKEFIYNDNLMDNFIDCGPNMKVETEPNTPLVDLDKQFSSISDEDIVTDIIDEINVIDNKIEVKPLLSSKRKLKHDNLKRVSIKRKVNKEFSNNDDEDYVIDKEVLDNKEDVKLPSKNRKSKNEINERNIVNEEMINKLESNIEINRETKNVINKRKVKNGEQCVKEEGFSRIRMTQEELLDSIEKRKLDKDFINAPYKCKSCVEVLKDQIELEEHNTRLHVQKPKFIQCEICQVYIKFWWLPDHRKEHYLKYRCQFCTKESDNVLDILTHLKDIHSMRSALTPGIMKNLKRKSLLMNSVFTPKQKEVNDVKTNEESNVGFKCSDCDKYFETRYLRYKHILKIHREGHKCATCGKTFAFKNTLNKHEQIHGAPQPTEQCPTCGKMVRRDRVNAHARIHATRATFECVACDKRFVSRDSYEKHLKYSSSHAVTDVHKYKCTMCEKGFRTMRELNDHVNYNHMGKTVYKCPICHKALATRRCVTRHVSRAHHGIKEKSGDKILCQTCGKAFRDKKCLREHELIHTGEKPLACDMCGRTFRQSACLYTHRRRVHKVAPKRLQVRHAGSGEKPDTQTEIH